MNCRRFIPVILTAMLALTGCQSKTETPTVTEIAVPALLEAPAYMAAETTAVETTAATTEVVETTEATGKNRVIMFAKTYRF